MSKIDDLLDLKWNFVKEACKDLKCKGAYITEDEYNSLFNNAPDYKDKINNFALTDIDCCVYLCMVLIYLQIFIEGAKQETRVKLNNKVISNLSNSSLGSVHIKGI